MTTLTNEHARNKPARSRVQQAAETREELIRAAMALFAQHGYGEVSVQTIGAAIGGSRGLVNFHFGSKDGLLEAVVERVIRDWEHETLLPLVGDRTGLDAVRAAVDAHRQALADSSDMVRIYYALMFEALGPGRRLSADFAHLSGGVRELVATWIRQGVEAGEIRADVDPEATAVALLGAVRGISYQYLLEPDSIDVDKAHSELERMMVSGLSAG